MSEQKPTNPKDTLAINKVPMHTVPPRVLLEIALGMAEGGLKYGTYNYREAGVRASVYYDGIMRHLMPWWEGEDLDPDSGLSHVTKAITDLIVLRDSMIEGNWVDDRPPAEPKVRESYMAPYNEAMGILNKKYPNPVEPFTQAKRYDKAVDAVYDATPRSRPWAKSPDETWTVRKDQMDPVPVGKWENLGSPI